ncbi:MAG TPA: pyridoxamine 5'-phosphate oxidase [bacterium]
MKSATDPIQLFASLYRQVYTSDIPESAAVTLATSTGDGRPSARVVLLKGFDEHGFVFYTNLESRKAQEIKANSNGALCFYWPAISYQVRIEGEMQQVSDQEADAYFATRPRGSQIGAWASRQSAPLKSREELQTRFSEFEKRFVGQTVPRPVFWSGFRLMPNRIEFWQGRENRLHERTLYVRRGNNWTATLLFP